MRITRQAWAVVSAATVWSAGVTECASIQWRFYRSPTRLPGRVVAFTGGAQADIRPTRGEIAVDGHLDEWQVRQRFAFLVWTATGSRGKPTGEMFAAYDADALYLAIRCPESEKALATIGGPAEGPRRDRGDVELGDCVQLYFDADRDPKRFSTITIGPRGDWDDAQVTDAGATRWLPPEWFDLPSWNPVGDFFGAQGYGRSDPKCDLSWNPRSAVAVGREVGAWTAELRLPWRDLGVESLASLVRIQFNAVRAKRTGESQVTVWARCGARYFVPHEKELHYAAKYGCLRLRPAPFALDRALMPRPLYGGNTLQVALRGARTPESWPVRVVLSRYHGGHERELASVDAEWKSGTTRVSIPVRFDLLPYDPDAETFALRLRIETTTPQGESLLIEDLSKEFRITPAPLHSFVVKGRYYDTERAATGIVKVNAAENVWRKGALRLEVRNAEGNLLTVETIRPLRERGVAFSIPLSGLLNGDYMAQAALVDGAGQTLASSSSRFEKAPAPENMRPVDARRTVPLRIDDPHGTREGNVPLYCGVPFPEGQLGDAADVRLVDDRGQDTPCQVEVLKRWGPGESIQWLGVHFNGELGGQRSYRLEYGRQVRCTPAEGIRWEEENGVLTVDTGAMKCVLRRGSPRLVDKVHVGDMQMVGRGSAGLSVTDDQGVVYDFRPDAGPRGLEVELDGSLHLILRREGAYASKQGDTVSRQILRLHFYAGRREATAVHTWVFTADSDEVRLRDIAVGLNLTNAGDRAEATFNTAAEPTEVAHYAVGPGQAVCMRQEWYPHFGDTRSVFGLYRRGDDREDQLLQGKVAGAWASLRTSVGTVTMILKDLAYMFPKELEVRDNAMVAHLWTDRGGLVMDLSTKGMMKYWGEDFSKKHERALSRLPSQAYGIARTHELTLRFDARKTGLGQAAPGPRLAARVQRPPYVLPATEWTCASGVFGKIHPVDDERFPEAEHFLRDRMDRILGIVGLWDFGFFDYGAGPHNAYHFDDDGRFHVGHYRYTDHEYGTDKYLWLHLWRSSERRYFEHAVRHSAFQMDLVQCHETNETLERYAGLYNINSVIPWSGKHSTIIGTHFAHRIEVPLYHYFFTGRRRALDVVREYVEGKKRCYGYARFAPFNYSFNGMGRSAFADLRELQTLYEFTGDPQLLEMCHGLASELIQPDSPAGINLDKRVYPPSVSHEKYKVVPLKHYCDLTRRREIRRSFEKLARWTYETYNRGGVYGITYARGAWGYMFANAYRLTGDERYAAFLQAGLDAMVRNVGHFATNRLPERNWKRAGYMLSAPYAMAVLAELKEPPPLPVSIIPEALPHRVYLEKGEPPVTIELFCEKPDGLRLVGPDGEDASVRLGPTPRPKYLTLRLGEGASSGVYQLYHAGRERWIVTRSSAERLVVSAAQGMLMDALEGCPRHFFWVPGGTEQFSIRTSSPEYLEVVDAEGREAKPTSSERGVLYFDVEVGEDGATWALDVSRFSRTRDYGQSVFVALEGVPAVLAPQSAQHFFLPPGNHAAPPGDARERNGAGPFVPGRSSRSDDRALRLTDGATLTVPLGKQLDTLSFEYFDARQGTVEMFLRFLKTPAEFSQFWSMGVCHDAADFYNFGVQYGFPKRTFWIEFRGESGGRTRWHHSGLPPVFLMDGRWHHVALTWHHDGVHLQAELFVDGLRVTYEDRLPPLQPKPPAAGLMFGGGQGNVEPFCGEIDDVRISKTVRYCPPQGPRLRYQRPLTLQPCFTPPGDGELAVDEHTLALFRFDGTVEGVGVERRRPIRAALSQSRHDQEVP